MMYSSSIEKGKENKTKLTSNGSIFCSPGATVVTLKKDQGV